jgi:hypothetical protein
MQILRWASSVLHSGEAAFRENRVMRSTEVNIVPFVLLADMVFPTSPAAVSL